jgi:hypothetical protein
MYSHDVRTGRTSEVKPPLVDVYDETTVFGDNSGAEALVLSTPGRAEERYPDLEPRARLSASGNYVLSVESTKERHAAAIVDTRTGELWRVPKNEYPWLAWSYGDIAMVDYTDSQQLLACDAARRTCETLPAEHPILMPTN